MSGKKKNKKEKKEEDFIYEENSDFSDEIKKLKEKIKKLEAEKKEYLEGWQRERATLSNLKKEFAEEKSKLLEKGKEEMIMEIIPVLDNFEAAFSNKEVWEKVDQSWRTGIEYIYKQFLNILENNGIISFGEVGDEFDEKRFLSIEVKEAEKEKEKGKVYSVIQKGYKKGDKILREAKVKNYK